MSAHRFTLSKELSCTVPAQAGVCAGYAEKELIRLLAKLGTGVTVSGKNHGLLFTLGKADRIQPRMLKKIKGNGFVSGVT